MRYTLSIDIQNTLMRRACDTVAQDLDYRGPQNVADGNALYNDIRGDIKAWPIRFANFPDSNIDGTVTITAGSIQEAKDFYWLRCVASVSKYMTEIIAAKLWPRRNESTRGDKTAQKSEA